MQVYKLTGWLPGWITGLLTSFLPSLVSALTSWILIPLLIGIVENLAHWRDHDTYAISDYDFADSYLPQYKIGMQAGNASGVMCRCVFMLTGSQAARKARTIPCCQ